MGCEVGVERLLERARKASRRKDEEEEVRELQKPVARPI